MATSSISSETQQYLASRSPEEIEEILQAFRLLKNSNPALPKTKPDKIFKKNKTKTSRSRQSKNSAGREVKRPLNSFVAFRSYYSTIFISMQQKNVSGLMQDLWKHEPFQSTWALIAKAYTLFRDHFGALTGSLSKFLELACTFLEITKPENYLKALGWTFLETENGKSLCRAFTCDLQAVAPKQSVTVSDIMEHCKEAGFVADFADFNLVDPSFGSGAATLTMSVLPSSTLAAHQATFATAMAQNSANLNHSSNMIPDQVHESVHSTGAPSNLQTSQQVALQHIFGTTALQASVQAGSQQAQEQAQASSHGNATSMGSDSKINNTSQASKGSTFRSHVNRLPERQLQTANLELTEEMQNLFRVLESTGGENPYDVLFTPGAPAFVNFELPDNRLFEDTIDFNAGLPPNFFDD